MIALNPTLHARWQAPQHVGAAKPTQTVTIQQGYMQRKYDTDGHWTAVWTPDGDPMELPGVSAVSLDWSFDDNGIQSATIDVPNVYAQQIAGPLGSFHRMQAGWYSPLRTWQPPKRPPTLDRLGKRMAKNQWDRVLGEGTLVTVAQGYGDQQVVTFSGLVDQVNGAARPASLRLTARDMGQLLTDVHPFGWNIDPKLNLPVTFVDIGHYKRLRDSNDPANRKLAEHYRKTAVVIRDVTDIAVHACRWAGFPKGSLRIDKAGISITQTTQFGPGEFLIDLVKQVQDGTGMTFFIGHPTPSWPLGRPTMRMSNTSWTVPTPVEEVRDDQLLTDFSWQHTDEPLAGIIRVRGKETPTAKGGRTLGKGLGTAAAVMAVYRPPWHRFERDARLIKHVTHIEPLVTTQYRCAVMARQIALQEALAANTGSFEIPAHPGLELDDILSVVERATGINSRVGIAQLQTTFTKTRDSVDYKQTIGVTLLDTPDVVQVVDELGKLLRQGSRLHPDVHRVDPTGWGMIA